MHRRFLELLASAKGDSKPVLALNLDVRSFSQFSLEVDSVETALYVRKMYGKVLTEYFPDASFFKPTGDGLMVVFDLEDGDIDDLTSRANQIVDASIRLVEDFGNLLDGDEWIYFDPPKKIGIGIARGAACQLVADDLTLDYSGTALNVASRLMDVARPHGLVLDQTFPVGLLKKELRDRLEEDDKVYLRSVAESFPRRVFYNPSWTEISPPNRRPLEEVEWKEWKQEWTFSQFLSRASNFLITLEHKPIDPKEILVRVDYRSIEQGKQIKGVLTEYVVPDSLWEYQEEAGEHRVKVNFRAISERLTKEGMKKAWLLTFAIRYPT